MVTMHDVARAAGVSQAAVSNVYNHPHKVSTRRRELILRVAAELGYAGPNPAGRSLRTGRVGALGLLLTESLHYAFDDPATSELLKGISEVGEMAEVALTLLPLVGGERLASGSGVLVTGSVDGFLAYAIPEGHPSFEIAVGRGLPVVVIDGPNPDNLPSVGINDAAGAIGIAEHVLGLGHTRVAVMVDRLAPDGKRGRVSAARIRSARDYVMRERLGGYAEAFRNHGLPWSSVYVLEAGGFDYQASRSAARHLLDNTEVTAVVAASDVLAMALMDELAERGLSVPGDMSVVGFDDVPAAARRGLTTVRQPLIDKGREAAQLLIDLIAGRSGRSITLSTELIVRDSCIAAR
ncbi:LacI family transcriptional regulator [Mycobacterium dioxanotrophicus]|jgi:DNA-binding LacI/PurR family transcriptional regulator|uniref:LacI family transcriptional regulator n=1 Tax=Mycobacterium dioxanotrophicus TaxID=482462 RepID=A0A1Y0BZE2_9MYCO|nr:LacI family DNA-binding transcriptional regulator [Mycobacterium dioxanotrophicus]ART68236.1 LacI family transcriptional regulator [Mycobacterium dioxanotrophicus]